MPLIQWIMQNLSAAESVFSGAKAGGTAETQVEYSITVLDAGALVSGESIDQQIISLEGIGGLEAGGVAGVNKQTGRRNIRKVSHLPGDLVYDKHNKPWIVVSFEVDSSKNEALYKLTNYHKQKFLYDSEVTEISSIDEDILEIDVLNKIYNIQKEIQNINYTFDTNHKVLRNYMPGDIIYDQANKPWVVVSFEVDLSMNEAVYKLTDSRRHKTLYDSELTEMNSDNFEVDVINKIYNLKNSHGNKQLIKKG